MYFILIKILKNALFLQPLYFESKNPGLCQGKGRLGAARAPPLHAL
jgi:hypothetical protein